MLASTNPSQFSLLGLGLIIYNHDWFTIFLNNSVPMTFKKVYIYINWWSGFFMDATIICF